MVYFLIRLFFVFVVLINKPFFEGRFDYMSYLHVNREKSIGVALYPHLSGQDNGLFADIKGRFFRPLIC